MSPWKLLYESPKISRDGRPSRAGSGPSRPPLCARLSSSSLRFTKLLKSGKAELKLLYDKSNFSRLVRRPSSGGRDPFNSFHRNSTLRKVGRSCQDSRTNIAETKQRGLQHPPSQIRHPSDGSWNRALQLTVRTLQYLQISQRKQIIR